MERLDKSSVEKSSQGGEIQRSAKTSDSVVPGTPRQPGTQGGTATARGLREPGSDGETVPGQCAHA